MLGNRHKYHSLMMMMMMFFFYSDVKVLLATNNSTDHQYDNKELCYQNVKKQLALRQNVLHHTFVSKKG